ncbi:MAG: hypothetical protein R3246_02630 [Acidimicrobiia bacterium]|nr:hypothetical protein [Acidimicrobiia bacterium]
MRARSETVLRDLLPAEEAAIEQVVARYQRVSPAVTRFARSLSGNPQLRVRLGAEAAAGPEEIVCDPRLFQAAYNRNAPVTADEVAIASALHEVVHLVSTDLDEKRVYPSEWPSEKETGDTPVDLLSALERAGGAVAEALFFTLEDARQEAQGLTSYPGARSVLSDLYRAGYVEAMRSAGALSQFALSCFLVAGGYSDREPLERRMDARAAVALADAGDVLERTAESSDPWEVGTLALELLEIARRNQLLTRLEEDATNARKKAADEKDADSVARGTEQVRLPSPVVRDAESYQDTRRASQARAGQSDRKGASELAGDATTDQLLRVSEAPTVYLPTGQSGKLVVTPVPHAFRAFAQDGRAALAEAAVRWDVAQRQVSGELFPLFAANQRRGLRSGYDQGDVSPHAALFIGAGLYTRMYERRAARTRRTYAVSLLVDASASMLQPREGVPGRRSSWGMAAALLGAWTLARLCDELQIDFEVAMFNRSFAARPDDTEWSYSRGRSQATAGLRQTQGSHADRLTSTVNHYLVKPFDRRWREAEDLLAGMFYTAAEPTKAAGAARRDARTAPPVSMFDKASNVDEYNVTMAAERLGRLGSSVRVLVVLADGMTRGSLRALEATVADVERSGTTVLGIGIGDDTVTTAYGRHQVVERPEDLTRAMVDGVRSSLRRSLALYGMDTWWLRSARPTTNLWKEQASA